MKYIKLPSPMMLLFSGAVAYWLASIIHLSFLLIAIMILLYIPLLSFIGVYAEQRKYLIQNKKVKKGAKSESKAEDKQSAAGQAQPLAIATNQADVPRLTNESGKH